MDIRAQLLADRSKANIMRIAAHIGPDPGLFKDLMEIFLGDHARASHLAGWVMSHCTDSHPQLVLPYLADILDLMEGPVHNSVRRNGLRAMQYVEIPVSLQGRAADLCFRFLESSSEPVAVKVFAMTVLQHIARKEPDLGRDLRLLIEDQLPYQSPAFTSRAARVLKALGKPR